jgi:uncharacterized membrane protein HdeD (DUF308 family)
MNNTMKTTGPLTVADTFSFNWWLLALRGLIAVAFGAAAFAWPAATLLSLVWLFGVFALLNGILSIVSAVKTPKGYPKPGGLIVGGILGVLVGLFAFFIPGSTALGFVLLIGAWAMLIGITEFVTAVKLRSIITDEWLLGAAGIASLLFGILLCIQPGIGALVLLWSLAAWSIVFGILLMIVAFRMRHLKCEVTVRSVAF